MHSESAPHDDTSQLAGTQEGATNGVGQSILSYTLIAGFFVAGVILLAYGATQSMGGNFTGLIPIVFGAFDVWFGRALLRYRRMRRHNSIQK